MTPPLRFGFVTCVQLGLSCMEEIAALGGRIDAALTIPDDRSRAKSGRVWIDAHCARHGIPLGKFGNINDPEAVAWLRTQALDWLFIIGWSQIARAEVLSSVRRGVIGMHPTLLPQGRGRAAVPWAILHGLERTGVSMFKLDAGVDTGPLLAQVPIPVAPRETATTLYAKVEEAHRTLIRVAWPRLVADDLPLRAQDEAAATVWPGRTPEDGRLDPSMTVAQADRLVRAVTRPYPGAFIDLAGVRRRVWSAIPAALDPAAAGPRLRFADGDLVLLEATDEPAPA
ncbi:MAG: methionyl-tRNA formyltransferase [Gemmatimonadetes bacterium]|nr:methionyl-tRNA formyltransferase [Gemmatimonadota bacterium]